MPSVASVTLELVCLDGWKFEVHGGDSRKHSSSAMENEFLYVGTVPLREYESFIENVASLLIDAEKRTGVYRSAARNQQGNQKTPAMIQAVMIDALAIISCTMRIAMMPDLNGTPPYVVGCHLFILYSRTSVCK